jgi:hypothetical protein
MSCEPEDDANPDPMSTPEEWANWALFGSPYTRELAKFHPLRDLYDRIVQAMRGYARKAQRKC